MFDNGWSYRRMTATIAKFSYREAFAITMSVTALALCIASRG